MVIAMREQEQGPERSNLEDPSNTRTSTTCPSKEDQNKEIVSQNDAEHRSHLGRVQEGRTDTWKPIGGERRPEHFSRRCVAKAHESDCLLRAMNWEERDEDLDGQA